MTDITMTLRLFGAFRKYGEIIEITLPAGCSVQDIKNKLAEKFDANDGALVHDSAVANDNEIINTDCLFNEDTELAILPPVCGG